MVRRTSDIEPDPVDRDERLGEAIEAYLALVEAGQAPDPSSFAAGYPDLEEDLFASLEGLALVQGLVGEPTGPGHRLESGRRVAGYRIVRELGRGGMGIVYEAVHVGLDRPVALKVLGSSAAPDSSGRRRFLNEARTAAGLHHTHIVPVFDVGQVGGLCYYAMQRIEGSGLDRVIKHLRRDRTVAAGSTYPGRHNTPHPPGRPATIANAPSGTGLLGDSTATWGSPSSSRLPGHAHDIDDDEPTPFEPPRGSAYYRWVATVGRQAAEALAHAHQGGVIHRDVKPSNLLVDARGVVWMADFGLARRLADPSQTQIDSLLGTPRYMSPEQSRTGPIDGRSDIYSLGATLYELLTLRPPFEGRTAAELIDQIAGRDPATPRQFDPRVPRDLETIVIKALHKRPGDRYATADEFADDLGRYLSHEPVRARRIGPIGRAWRVARRHPSLTAVSAAAIATVIATSTVAYSRVLHERDMAREARNQAQDVAGQLEEAVVASHDALREQYLQGAQVVRKSDAADRRSAGLELLRKAAIYSPEPDQRARLRDEAVAFLSIRDVEKRPEIPIDSRVQGLVFGPRGERLATLSEDLTTVQFWDVETRALVHTHRLEGAAESAPASSQPQRGPGPAGGPGAGGGRGRGTRIAQSGQDVAVVHPDNKGVLLLNAATGSVTSNLRLFDRQAPEVGPPEPEFKILGLAASADGRRLLTISSLIEPEPPRIGRSTDGDGPSRGRFVRVNFRVHLWDAMDPDQPLAMLFDARADSRSEPTARSPFPLAAISPDGSTVAIAAWNDTVIDVFTGDDLASPTKIDSQSRLTALALGPDGLLAAADSRAVHLWDLGNAAASLGALTPGQSFVQGLRFSPDDGTLLAVAGGGPGAGVEIWDISTSSRVALLPTPDDLSGLAMAPGSKMVAFGQPSSLTLWAVVDPMAQKQLAALARPPASIAYSPRGEIAVATFDNEVRRWSPDRCPTTARVVTSVQAGAVAFDPSGRLLAPGRDQVVWLAPDNTTIARAHLPESYDRQPGRNNLMPTAFGIAASADGRSFAIARPRGGPRGELLLVRLLDDGTPGPIVRLEMPEPPRPGRPPQDRGGPPPSRGGGIGPRLGMFVRIALAPDGSRLYLTAPSTTPEESTVSAWSVAGDRLVEQLWSIPARFPTLALSPDGRTLAVGDRSGVVLLVDTEGGHVARRLDPPEVDAAASALKDAAWVHSLAFAPDGRGLAVGGRDQVRLWSLDGPVPRPHVRLPGHRGPVLSLAYDPRGGHLASGGEDKLVKVWDLDRVRGELARLGLD